MAKKAQQKKAPSQKAKGYKAVVISVANVGEGKGAYKVCTCQAVDVKGAGQQVVIADAKVGDTLQISVTKN